MDILQNFNNFHQHCICTFNKNRSDNKCAVYLSIFTRLLFFKSYSRDRIPSNHNNFVSSKFYDLSLFTLCKIGSGSTRPGTTSAPESTWPRVNSAGSTRPVYFPYGELGYHIYMYLHKKFGRYDLRLVLRKPVFGVSDQVPHKPGCTATEDG